jgi:hypothetical protein
MRGRIAGQEECAEVRILGKLGFAEVEYECLAGRIVSGVDAIMQVRYEYDGAQGCDRYVSNGDFAMKNKA